LQDDYRASRLVIRCIEPVAKVVGLVAMRFVTTLIMEVVYRYGEVMSRIDVAEVDGSSSDERQGADEKGFHGEEYEPVGMLVGKLRANTNVYYI
jgi:hypothetical protein